MTYYIQDVLEKREYETMEAVLKEALRLLRKGIFFRAMEYAETKKFVDVSLIEYYGNKVSIMDWKNNSSFLVEKPLEEVIEELSVLEK